jgi:hypothetical protein
MCILCHSECLLCHCDVSSVPLWCVFCAIASVFCATDMSSVPQLCVLCTTTSVFCVTVNVFSATAVCLLCYCECLLWHNGVSSVPQRVYYVPQWYLKHSLLISYADYHQPFPSARWCKHNFAPTLLTWKCTSHLALAMCVPFLVCSTCSFKRNFEKIRRFIITRKIYELRSPF